MMESNLYDSKLSWVRKKRAWRDQFLLHKSYPGLGSWLSEKKTGIGCKVCSAQCCKNSWGKHAVSSPFMLQTCVFRRHEKSHGHKRAVQTYLQHFGIAATQEPIGTWYPSVDELSRLIDEITEGKIGVVGRKKTDAILLGGRHQHKRPNHVGQRC